MQEKRSLKNIVLTKKHHWAYLGKWVLLSQVQVALLYSVCIYHVISVSWHGADVNVIGFIAVATVIGVSISAVIAFLGILTAHRIAGVHVKLKNTFDALAEGDESVRLRFRSYDKLDDVANSFNHMMEAVHSRRSAN